MKRDVWRLPIILGGKKGEGGGERIRIKGKKEISMLKLDTFCQAKFLLLKCSVENYIKFFNCVYQSLAG